MVGVLVLDLCVALFVFHQIAVHADYPFDSDEGFHAQGGLELALDLRSRDWPAFLGHAYRQATYPPGFSVVEALALLAFGFSATVARSASLLCLAAATLVIYAVGLELDEGRGWLVGAVGVALTLVGLPILATAGLVMLEPAGLLASLGTLWAYLRADRSPGPGRLAVVGVLVGATFLTKYPYGIVAGGTVAIAELVRVGTGPWSAAHRASLARRWAWLFGPLALMLAAWFVGPDKVGRFLAYAHAQKAQVALFSLENLLFHPRSFAYHHAPSPVWAAVSLVALAWAAPRWRNPRLRLMLIYVAVGGAVMTYVLEKLPRYMVTIVPAVHILTGALVAWVVEHWADRAVGRRRVAVLVGAAMLVCAAASVPTLVDRAAGFHDLMRAEYETDPRANEVAAWIVARVPPAGPVVLVNPWDQFHAAALEWYRATRAAALPRAIGEVRVAYVNAGAPATASTARLVATMRRHGASHVVVLEGDQPTVGGRSTYVAVPGPPLALVDRREWSLDFHDMATWLRLNMVTRAGLRQAMADHHRVLRIRVSIYEAPAPRPE